MRVLMLVWLGGMWLCVTVAQAEIGPVGSWGIEYTCRLQGTYGRKQAPIPAYATLNGGYRECSNQFMAFATFTHNAGTNHIVGRLTMMTMEPTTYILHSGLLQVDTFLFDPIGSAARFWQYGGTHRVNRLQLQTYQGRSHCFYHMEWGDLEVRDVTILDNAVFDHRNGTVHHTGILAMAGGTWQAKPGMQELGELLVARSVYGSSNSSLAMPAAPAVIRFADSRAQNWETGATLFIRNWDGSPDGGGEQQVFFGDGNGITTQQLAQIRFVNVVGQLPGVFPAKQTATGEIVPVIGPEEPPVLRITSRTSSSIYLTWPVGYTLQSATNSAGPFEDMWRSSHTVPNSSGGASEWCHPFDRTRIYRLRK